MSCVRSAFVGCHFCWKNFFDQSFLWILVTALLYADFWGQIMARSQHPTRHPPVTRPWKLPKVSQKFFFNTHKLLEVARIFGTWWHPARTHMCQMGWCMLMWPVGHLLKWPSMISSVSPLLFATYRTYNLFLKYVLFWKITFSKKCL